MKTVFAAPRVRLALPILIAATFGVDAVHELRAADGASATAQLASFRGMAEPLIPLSENPADADSSALLDAVKAHLASRQKGGADFSAMERYLASYPTSPWRMAVLLNLGIDYYQHGFFSRALEAWRQSWELGRDAETRAGRALADRAFAEWAKMLSRLGRTDELGRALAGVEGRAFRGMAAEMVQTARDSLWMMTNHPEKSYRCGPHALERILAYTQPAKGMPKEIVQSESSPQGIQLSSVAALARQIGFDFQIAKRIGEGDVPLPAVVHWKLNHYGALLKKENGRYLLDDPTFANGLLWITEEALNAESSGYFLIRKGSLLKGWTTVADQEAAGIWGRGYPGGDTAGGCGPGNPDSCPASPPDPPPGDNSCQRGMAAWKVYLMMCSLNVSDSPVGYEPPVGPGVFFNLSYNQRETNQPVILNYSNFGPLWSFDWVGSLTFDSANAYFNRGQGGIEVFTGFNNATQSYSPNYQLGHQLIKLGATHYELRRRDGGKLVFAVADNPISPARIFMSQFVDAQGNAVTLSYDGSFRLTTITDAIGQQTTLAYTVAADPTLVTKVTDPFGRFATFEYNASGQLTRITDVIGMTSEFTYDASDTMLTLTTGYGTTSFSIGGTNGNNRFVETTHPNGDKERFEQRNGATTGIPFSEPANLVPQGIPLWNLYLDGRNSIHWDRKAMKEGPGDASKARIYHFMHQDLNTRSPVLESIKMPYENRTWFKYQGQNNIGFYSYGMYGGQPAGVARVLEDGTTQLWQKSFNSLGNVTKEIDPAGRTVTFAYAGNGIDLIEIRRKTGEGSSVRLVAATYNATHLPLTVTDAAGETTVFTYNNKGQLLTTTNAKGGTTTFNYNAQSFLASIDGPLAGPSDTVAFTYDSAGRLQTWTGSDGYVLSYEYDALDRETRTTFPDGTFQQTTWTLLQPTTFADRRGRTTQYAYDSLRQLSSETDPLGRVIRYLWCKCGAISALIDPLGRKTSWLRDVSGRTTAKEYPDGSRITYQYDATGRLKAVTDAENQTKILTWRADEKLDSVSYLNSGIPTPSVRFGYDEWFPRQTQRLDGVGLTRFEYYPITETPTLGAGRMRSEDGPLENDTITLSYDELGRVTGRSINGIPQTIGYDMLDRVIGITNALGAFAYTYVGATARVASMAYPNGQSAGYDYFPNLGDRRLKQILNKRPGGAALSKFDYTYDPEGEILTWSQQADGAPERVWTSHYDLADQLTGITSTVPAEDASWTYDPAGNRLTETRNGNTVSASYNSVNELHTISAPAQDDHGYEWDAAERLVAINYTGTARRTEMTYDGLGRRSAIIEKNGGTITSTKRFRWCGSELSEERNASGDVVTRRFFNQGEKIESGPDAGTYFYSRDHLGSVREMLDASGSLRARVDFDAWGRAAQIAGNMTPDFGFTGHYQHADAKLALAPLRAYSSGLGRWLSRDPVQETGGINLYAYVRNKALRFIDPYGDTCYPPLTKPGDKSPVLEPGDTVSVGDEEWTYLGSWNSWVGNDGHGNVIRKWTARYSVKTWWRDKCGKRTGRWHTSTKDKYYTTVNSSAKPDSRVEAEPLNNRGGGSGGGGSGGGGADGNVSGTWYVPGSNLNSGYGTGYGDYTGDATGTMTTTEATGTLVGK